MNLIIDQQYIPLEKLQQFEALELSRDPSFISRINKAAAILLQTINAGNPIYGVTTGYGEAGKNYLNHQEAALLQQNLYRFHGCGVGDLLSQEESKLILILRMISLAKGASGVSFELLEAMEDLLRHQIYPAIPSQGSVGASGDLTPLSYIAALLAGEREAFYQGEVVDAAKLFKKLHITPYAFKPKEALAIMNGTSAMSGIALAAIFRFEILLETYLNFCAGFFEIMLADTTALMKFVHAIKPFEGQQQCAQKLLEKIDQSLLTRNTQGRYEEFFATKEQNIQDRYSIRCIPQVLGPVIENLTLSKKWLEIEINSVSDNPLVCVQEERIYTGCNFYGGYVAHACDTLKISIGNIADLLDKQFASMVDEKLNRGLGENLKLRETPLFHGFKAMQITLSSLSADVLTKMLPASLFSRATESLNQDKVSMGTTAAISMRNALDDFEKMVAIGLLGLAQASEIRGVERGSPALRELHKKVRQLSPALLEDRRLDGDILKVVEAIRGGTLL